MQADRFPIEVVNGVPVAAAPEEIDITNAQELRAILLEAAARGHRTLVADLTRTRFCDSSGLHTLLAAHKRAQAEGGELLLVMPSPAVLRVFAITSVDRMIPNFTSLEEALARTSANGSNGHRRASRGPESSTVRADLTKAPADHGTRANMARRAPGGPAKAQPSANAGSTAPQDAAAAPAYGRVGQLAAHANSAPAAPLTPVNRRRRDAAIPPV